MYSVIATALLASLVPQAFATLFVTSPVASTSCAAGQPCNVAWNDDGQKPSLSDIGACTVGLYVGSVTQQTMLQDLGPVDVSKQATAQFIPVANIGPNSNIYFLRFTSTSLKDTANPQYNFETFTAKFTLTGMTGQFNSTVQQQIDGATAAASTPAATSAGSASPSAAAASSPSSAAASASSPSKAVSSTAAKAAASGSPSPSNAAMGRMNVGSTSVWASFGLVLVSAVAALTIM